MRKLNNFGFSHVLIPVLVFVMLGAIGGAYFLNQSGAAPAPAATTTAGLTTGSTSTTVTPDLTLAVGNTVHLCLNSAQGECIVTSGPGNPARIQTSGYATWHVLSAGPGSRQFQNSAGNCLKANLTGNGVTVASGGCTNSLSESWDINATGTGTRGVTSYRLQNEFNLGLLATTDKQPGFPVLSDTSGSSSHYYAWIAK